MDKRKLVNIIVKDLEEIKNLSEEVANSQDDSCLVIDLALNRARLLCQEIELLRELVGNSFSMQKETDQDRFEDDNDESNISFPDPELEILHFEEREFPETEELTEEKTSEEDDEELVEEDFEDKYQEEDKSEDQDEFEQESTDEELAEDDLTELEDEDMDEDEPDEEVDQNEDEPEITEELAEDDLTELEDEDIDDEDEQDEEEEDFEEEEQEEPLQNTNIQVNELSNHPHPGIREIHIDDLDDDEDIETVNFSHLPGSSIRPPMREIPKPENIAPEKTVIGETFQKERSLNDSIGENKSESKLSNSPITSLRAAIGLNDRFIFIREIFDNNSEKYNTIIEKLDKMEHIQEAVEYLKANLSMQKNEASMKFVDLLKRRFTK